MIREILDQYFDTGIIPKLALEEDPFWDPPNPILIGQSFLQLTALGLQLENTLEASILSIDGMGGKRGQINFRYMPCDKNGNTDEDALDEDFMVENVEEILGLNDLYFKVFINNAYGLPPNLCNNPFVTYQFKFENNIVHQTEECSGETQKPVWNYSCTHKIDDITKAVVQELKEGSISFMIYAYPPMKTEMPKNDGGAAIKKRMTMRQGGTNSELMNHEGT
jgi:hypothetical protein